MSRVTLAPTSNSRLWALAATWKSRDLRAFLPSSDTAASRLTPLPWSPPPGSSLPRHPGSPPLTLSTPSFLVKICLRLQINSNQMYHVDSYKHLTLICLKLKHYPQRCPPAPNRAQSSSPAPQSSVKFTHVPLTPAAVSTRHPAQPPSSQHHHQPPTSPLMLIFIIDNIVAFRTKQVRARPTPVKRHLKHT